MGKALEGVRVLDMTHVQSGPSCAQIRAWMGADVIKLEAPVGDITRKPLRDIPAVDSLYFTMLRLPDQAVRLPVDVHRSPLLGDTTRTSTAANSAATTNSPASRPKESSDQSPGNRQNRQRITGKGIPPE